MPTLWRFWDDALRDLLPLAAIALWMFLATVAQLRRLRFARQTASAAVLDERSRVFPVLGALAIGFGAVRFFLSSLKPFDSDLIASPDQRKLLLARYISDSMFAMVAALVLAVVCFVLHVWLEAQRKRARADAELTAARARSVAAGQRA